jgi:hypothetical protein
MMACCHYLFLHRDTVQQLCDGDVSEERGDAVVAHNGKAQAAVVPPPEEVPSEDLWIDNGELEDLFDPFAERYWSPFA